MKFSRNPVSGTMEAYTDDGIFVGHVVTMGDLIPKTHSADDGGPGSGNHNHAGRPGKVGGSAPNKGGPTGGTQRLSSETNSNLIKLAKEARSRNDFIDSMSMAQFRELYKQKPEGENQEDFMTRMYEEYKEKELPEGMELKKDWTEGLPDLDKEFVKYKIERYGSESKLVNNCYDPATKLEFLSIMAKTNDWPEKKESRKFDNLTDEEKENMNFLLDRFPSEAGNREDEIYQGCSSDIHNYFAALKAKEMGLENIDVPAAPLGIKLAKEQDINKIIQEKDGGYIHTKAGDANRKKIKDFLSEGHMLGMDYIGLDSNKADAYRKAIIDSVENFDDRIAEMVASSMESANVGWFNSNGVCCFNPTTGHINIYTRNEYGVEYPPERMAHVFWHEYGHFMDTGGKSYNALVIKDPLKANVGCSGPSQLVNGELYSNAAAKDVQKLFDEAGISDRYEVRPGKRGEYPVKVYRKSDGKLVYITNADPDSDDLPVITNAINNLLFKKVGKSEEVEKYMENHGMPPATDKKKYFKEYYDEFAGDILTGNEEKYPGAKEDYMKAEEKRDEEFAKWLKTIGGYDGYVKLAQEKEELEKREEQKRKKYGAVTDCLDESVKGLFGMLVRWGGHEAKYYRGELHPNETSANIFSIMAENDPEVVAFMKSVIPNTSELFIKAWRVSGERKYQ